MEYSSRFQWIQPFFCVCVFPSLFVFVCCFVVLYFMVLYVVCYFSLFYYVLCVLFYLNYKNKYKNDFNSNHFLSCNETIIKVVGCSNSNCRSHHILLTSFGNVLLIAHSLKIVKSSTTKIKRDNTANSNTPFVCEASSFATYLRIKYPIHNI